MNALDLEAIEALLAVNAESWVESHQRLMFVVESAQMRALVARVRELEAVVHLVAEPRHGEPTTAALALVTCPTCLRRVAAAERALRHALEAHIDEATIDDSGGSVDAAARARRALGVEP